MKYFEAANNPAVREAFDRRLAKNIPASVPVNPANQMSPGMTDIESENVWNVLGKWPETDMEWAFVERALGYAPGMKAGVNPAAYRSGEVMGPSGMMATPFMGKGR